MSVANSALNPGVAGCLESRNIPTRRLKKPQMKFMIGGESAIPIGLEKGEGKGSPSMPLER